MQVQAEHVIAACVLPVLWCDSCVWERPPPSLPCPAREENLPPAASVNTRKDQHI